MWKAYKREDESRLKPVILKGQYVHERATREANILRELKEFCAGVPKVLDVFVHGRDSFTVLEYVGKSLAELHAAARLEPHTVCALFAKLVSSNYIIIGVLCTDTCLAPSSLLYPCGGIYPRRHKARQHHQGVK